MTEWTNDAAIQRWGSMPRAVLEQMAHDGDFAKRHLINPVLLRMLGDPTGQRVLDAGCGNGYLSRMLAERGAQVVGVEPGQSLFDFAVEQETATPQGIQYVQADLCALPNLGAPFNAVVASMVLPAVPDSDLRKSLADATASPVYIDSARCWRNCLTRAKLPT